ncbi:tetratricopeptide repeat-containing sulfotransferase family protein [Allosphingosinicella indica]|uniref:Tetratricopeptide repeat-containing protein n=1 Tax=Allosphingosinicella indica TaxID=941907 RepID=A0A1X7GT37_9SPHN|nr:tetratricopeptide repeat-containing sulfotransferase family protein [Allosphingosinicella indica]SMF74338.1 Tetratricopeptide repeat-containing protein [Allosphingosinicella indica]
MAAILPQARDAIAFARAGDISRALASGEAAVRLAPSDGGLRFFVGMLHTRHHDLTRAVPHLRIAAKLMTDTPIARLELARALIAVGRLDEAEETLAPVAAAGPAGRDLLGLHGLLQQRRGDHHAAIRMFRQAVHRDARDFENWANLGVSLLAIGQSTEAEKAFGDALELRPDLRWARIKRAEAAVGASRGEHALAKARAVADASPNDADAMLLVARIEELLDRPVQAEAALREALARDPRSAPAMIALATLAERDNRVEDCRKLLHRARAAGASVTETAILDARIALRQGDCATVMTVLRDAAAGIDPVARAELIGRCRDRAGDPEGAFLAFTEMNRHIAGQRADPAGEALAFRNRIDARRARATREWRQGWEDILPADRRSDPVFMFGFPRSGTTLLDTFLMGHPGVVVLEEQPVLQAAMDAVGGAVDDPAVLTAESVVAMRAAYFQAADRLAPDAAQKLLIDKAPLGAVEAALVHRLFPQARYIFVERHPCDVVLSGFMAAFDPRGGMANFLSLKDVAQLYDTLTGYWHHCRELFDLPTCNARYERLIVDPQAELGMIADFLGITVHAGMLDHRTTAGKRSHIPTPSYAQVSAPLHSRAAGRWLRYLPVLNDVMPILRPWAERMGYAM